MVTRDDIPTGCSESAEDIPELPLGPVRRLESPASPPT